MALQGGAGDSIQMNQKKPCKFEELPMPVLKHLCTFLTWQEQMRLRQLCREMKHFINYEYGIHAYLPSRNLNPNSRLSMFTVLKFIMGRLAGTLGHITDAMITRAILNLEGKVIRSWEMNEMHPEFNPFPFDMIVRYPWKLKRISLKYVDVQFLVKILSSCRNLSVFHYETALHRTLPEGSTGWLTLGPTFQPVPIPLENELLIEFVTNLPPITFQGDRLTSLSLTLQMVDTKFHSDWANVVFLLLTLSQANLPNLQDFKFTFTPESYCIYPMNHLQLIACIGQLLSRCPRLNKFEYISPAWSPPQWSGRGRYYYRRVGESTPEDVWSGLIKKYGSDLLKETLVPGVFGVNDEMEPIRQIMREAARQLEHLQEVSLTWSKAFERELFQLLVGSIPSIRISHIDDFTQLRITGDSYNLFFSEIPENCSIEKLCIRRCYTNFEYYDRYDYQRCLDGRNTGNRFISLTRMLIAMGSLRHFEITSKLTIARTENELELEEHERFPLDENPDVAETPDVTLEEVGDITFQQLEVLKLEGVKILTESTARLTQLSNLKELFLHVVPEYRHEMFVINSKDVFRLMGKLRKLDKLSLSPIMFPEDDILKSSQSKALQAIGTLTPLRRLTGGPVFVYGYYGNRHRLYLGGNNPTIIVVMNQFKFLFDNDA